MTKRPTAFVIRILLTGCLAGVAAALAALNCAGGDDSQPDTSGVCTLESCTSSCLGRDPPLPGGTCEGDLCVCNEPLPDADGDADGEETTDTPDRTDTRDDGRDGRDESGGETTEDGEATEDGETAEDAPREDTVREDAGPRCTDLSTAWTFNLGESGWTHAAVDAPTTGEFDPWVLGQATAGPGECRGGGTTNQCWTTGLAGSYDTCQTAELRSPTLDMAPCATSSFHVDIAFWQWHEFAQATGSNDGGTVEVSGDDGATWSQVAPTVPWDGAIVMSTTGCDGSVYVDGLDGFLGTTGRWEQQTIRVPAEYLTEQFAFRFVFGSDDATSGDGWFIDDVSVVVR